MPFYILDWDERCEGPRDFEAFFEQHRAHSPEQIIDISKTRCCEETVLSIEPIVLCDPEEALEDALDWAFAGPLGAVEDGAVEGEDEYEPAQWFLVGNGRGYWCMGELTTQYVKSMYDGCPLQHRADCVLSVRQVVALVNHVLWSGPDLGFRTASFAQCRRL